MNEIFNDFSISNNKSIGVYNGSYYDRYIEDIA